MRSRPLFRDGLDADTFKPTRILGKYEFKDEIPCGLLGCREMHKRGVHALVEDQLAEMTAADLGVGHRVLRSVDSLQANAHAAVVVGLDGDRVSVSNADDAAGETSGDSDPDTKQK